MSVGIGYWHCVLVFGVDIGCQLWILALNVGIGHGCGCWEWV